MFAERGEGPGHVLISFASPLAAQVREIIGHMVSVIPLPVNLVVVVPGRSNRLGAAREEAMHMCVATVSGRRFAIEGGMKTDVGVQRARAQAMPPEVTHALALVARSGLRPPSKPEPHEIGASGSLRKLSPS